MLSQETSIGAHPVEAVRAMARICQAAQKHPAFERARQIWREPGQVGSAIAHAAASTAAELHARVIIAFTESGNTALRTARRDRPCRSSPPARTSRSAPDRALPGVVRSWSAPAGTRTR
jgi:pyruvate kinase